MCVEMDRSCRTVTSLVIKARATAAREPSLPVPFWHHLLVTQDTFEIARLPFRLLGLLSLAHEMRLSAGAAWFKRFARPRFEDLGPWERWRVLTNRVVYAAVDETLGHWCRSVDFISDRVAWSPRPSHSSPASISSLLPPAVEFLKNLPSIGIGGRYRSRIEVHGITIACSVGETYHLADFRAYQGAIAFLRDDAGLLAASGLREVQHRACLPVMTPGEQMEVEINGVVFP